MKKEYSIIDEIRQDTRPQIRNRRSIAALAAIGLVDFSLISLFQIGYIKKLPDLPGEIFDTAKVNSSKDAVLLGIPDGVISLGAYAATMLLATIGSRSIKSSHWADLALAGLVAGQAVGAARYLVNMATVQKKVCIYCIGGALINFAAVKPALSLLFPLPIPSTELSLNRGY